jgi:hypothetical protein
MQMVAGKTPSSSYRGIRQDGDAARRQLSAGIIARISGAGHNNASEIRARHPV